MTTADNPQDRGEYTYIIRPNRSITWRATMIIIAVVASVCLTVATLFALKGAWMILPFAGAEVLLLTGSLYLCALRSSEYEVIRISEDLVRLEKGRNVPSHQVEFKRAWSRVRLNKNKLDWYPSRLTISSMGREVEVGARLHEDERVELARELQRMLPNQI